MRPHIFLFAFIILIGCKTAPHEPSGNFEFIGTWVYESSRGDTTIMKRANGLDSSKTGYIFHWNGKLTERKPGGWCATPPIYYANYEGEWSIISNNNLKITVGAWHGIEKYILEILTINENNLKFIKRQINE